MQQENRVRFDSYKFMLKRVSEKINDLQNAFEDAVFLKQELAKIINNSIYDFLTDKSLCDFGKTEHHYTSGDYLYTVFTAWALRTGHKPCTREEFLGYLDAYVDKVTISVSRGTEYTVTGIKVIEGIDTAYIAQHKGTGE